MRYTIQGPSGKTYTIEGPEGATADQLGQVILQSNKDERIALTRSQMAQEFDPTKDMGTAQRLAAGFGKGLTDIARGAGQWVGAVSRDDVKEARKADAPLMATTAGKVGEIAGKVVPSVALFGGGTVPAALATGAAMGALEPSESTSETVGNIALGGVAGAVGQRVANAAAGALANRATAKGAQFAAQQSAGAQKLDAARRAAAEGYVIPPSDIQKQGMLTEAIAGLSGKIKTAQQASAQNQQVTDRLARQAVGLAPDEALTRDVLATIRQQAGAAYDKFRTVGTVQADRAYMQALTDVESTLKGAVRSFPGLKSDEVANLVKTMRKPSFDAGDAIDATKVLRERSEEAFVAGNKGLAKAYRKVSDALEGALERHLQGTAPDAVKEFRQARQLIAKTYTVEKALRGETGEVSAKVLADQLKRGKPLSGELRTIAEAGEAFPKATQMLQEAPKQLSPLDFGAAGLGLVGSGGNPLAALGLIARPAARSAILSGPAQRYAMRDLGAPTARLANAANNPLAQLLYGPAAAGIALGQQ